MQADCSHEALNLPALQELEKQAAILGSTLNKYYGIGSGWRDIGHALKWIKLKARYHPTLPLAEMQITPRSSEDTKKYIENRNRDEYVQKQLEGRPLSEEQIILFEEVRNKAINALSHIFTKDGNIPKTSANKRATEIVDTISYILIQGM
ncbi:MAG: hypothetical protein D8M28_10190 [Proteobacteria bacterium]|nr:hypothetical protein [Pseudomonadota bacterium]